MAAGLGLQWQQLAALTRKNLIIRQAWPAGGAGSRVLRERGNAHAARRC
jgi:hypothetical protein